MARNVEDIIKEQLGNMLLQLSVLQSQVETLREVNVALKVELEKFKEEVKP